MYIYNPLETGRRTGVAILNSSNFKPATFEFTKFYKITAKKNLYPDRFLALLLTRAAFPHARETKKKYFSINFYLNKWMIHKHDEIRGWFDFPHHLRIRVEISSLFSALLEANTTRHQSMLHRWENFLTICPFVFDSQNGTEITRVINKVGYAAISVAWPTNRPTDGRRTA